MSPEELADLCRRRGYEVRVRRGEVQLKHCLGCGNDRWNLELSARKGVYNSWCCEYSGSLKSWLSDRLNITDVDVQVDLEDWRSPSQPVEELEFDPGPLKSAAEFGSARMYLSRRGITSSDIRRYEVQVGTDSQHPYYGRLVFPVREYWSGEHVGYVARSYNNKRPKYLSSAPGGVVVGYRQNARPGVHVLVEGVFDGVRVHQAGYQAAVILGLEQARLMDWADVLPSGDRVVIALDGEATDQAHQARPLLEQIPHVRQGGVSVLESPGERDPADWPVRGLARELGRLCRRGVRTQAG